jgi:hypothetical protein
VHASLGLAVSGGLLKFLLNQTDACGGGCYKCKIKIYILFFVAYSITVHNSFIVLLWGKTKKYAANENIKRSVQETQHKIPQVSNKG